MLLMLSSGQLLTNVHSDEECLGAFCPIHNPSQHTLREYPLSFSGTHFYRILPDNSLRVDPDDYLLNKNGYAILINALRCPECFDYLSYLTYWKELIMTERIDHIEDARKLAALGRVSEKLGVGL